MAKQFDWLKVTKSDRMNQLANIQRIVFPTFGPTQLYWELLSDLESRMT